MKKVLYTLAGLAMIALGAVSCQKEASFEAGKDGSVTFTVQLPGTDTKAISDGLTATELDFAIYDGDGKYLEELSKSATKSTFSGKKATVSVQVIKDLTYQFVFFAKAAENSPYTFTPADKKLSITYGAANLEAADAFYFATEPITVKGAFSRNITLTRPLAQINFGSSKSDIAAAKLSKIDVDGLKSSLVLTNVYSEMDLLTGKVTGEPTATVNLTEAAKPADALKVKDVDYGWIAMAYILAGDKEVTDLTLGVATTADGKDIALTREIANVPYQRNHRTNVLGNIFSVTADFTIVIDERFDQPDYDYRNTLVLAALKGGEFKLEEDVVLDRPLVVSSNFVLDLNGHTISNTEDIWKGDDWSLISVRGGSLTIKGEGKLDAKENDCYALDVCDGGSLVIEGGEFIGNITAVYVLEGKADIRGGKFNIKQLSDYNDCRYMINLYDANGRNGSASAVISGGSFYQFDPGNNAAEGPATNFLKEGFVSTGQDGWYNVDVKKIPVADGVTTDGVGNYIVDGTEGALAAALNHINENDVKNPSITLDGVVTWETGAAHGSTPLIPADNAATETVTFSGGTLQAIGDGVGPIRAANGGKLVFNDVIIEDHSVSYAETAWEFAYLEFAGKMEFNNCTFKSGINIGDEGNGSTTNPGDFIFNHCSFTTETEVADWNPKPDNMYLVWIDSDNAQFNDCEFTGFRGVKLHHQYQSHETGYKGIAVFDKCNFHDISKKPGLSFGKIDPAASITIKNSTFKNCQAGDQELHIYETDTDVTTFQFTQENNTVL